MTENNNDILSFIAKDTAASGQMDKLRFLSLAVLIFLPTVIVYLMGMNPNLHWLSSPRNWIVLLLLLCVLALFSIHIKSGKSTALLRLTSAASVGAALILPLYASEASIQTMRSDFWPDTLRCFMLGFLSSAAAASLLIVLFFKKGPLPTGPVRFSIAMLSSLVGVTVLFLHCPDTRLNHITAGHGLQFAAVLALTSLAINQIFSRFVRSTLGSVGQSFGNFSKFDK